MFTVQELYEIEDKILNGITENELRRILVGRTVYLTEGTVGELPIDSLPSIPYNGFIENILKIKRKDNLTYGGDVSLFSLVVKKIKLYDGLYHIKYQLIPTEYINFTDETIDTKQIW